MTKKHAIRSYPVRLPLTRPPGHPGALLREMIADNLRMPVAEAAAGLRISRQRLRRILSQRAGVTPEMALCLGKFLGSGPGLWLRMQEAHDLWHAERALRDEVARILTADLA
jgi:antitoxin HigA-1